MALLPWSCCLRSPTASGTALSRPLCIRSMLLVTSSYSIHSYVYLNGWPSSFSSKSAWKHGDLEPRCALTTKDVEEKPRHNRLQILISNPLDRVRACQGQRSEPVACSGCPCCCSLTAPRARARGSGRATPHPRDL